MDFAFGCNVGQGIGAKLVIQKAEFMVLRELELSWSQELIWNLWIEEKLTL
ncbi:uncharacterized protein G2W53_007768 [Senna tora]|uniref:Uncharacterized protein n=1 Tax=Senna tora TaxID=362788 RepID=A0A834X6R2_9FABA|nr:uncharacterized protein G2W53_007768 [Senna tora]